MQEQMTQSRPDRDWMCKSSVRGMVVLVAGGGSGIGEAVAVTLAANGARVAVADRRMEMAEAVVAQIRRDGGDALPIAMDVARQDDIDRGLERIVAEYGRIDALVNSAGVIMPAMLKDCSMEDWRTCFLVNVDAALLLARSCHPYLSASPSASIVNISSLAGGSGYPNGGAYGPSKAALISLSRQMALEWADDGIRVNVVNPGTIDTPLSRANMPAQAVANRKEKIPLHRIGAPEELADLVVFLVSPAASYVTAQAINCDGGLSQNLLAQKFNANLV